MSATRAGVPELEFHPATPARWADLERLFGARGALKRLVTSGDEPGILAYAGREPVGWCSLAPRDRFPRLERSRILRPVDDEAVWSVVCLFVTRERRGQGVSVALLRAAAEYAASRGARIVEGYPVDPKQTPMPAAFAWTGIASAYREAGFTEVTRRSETRPIMRWRAGRPRRRSAPSGR